MPRRADALDAGPVLPDLQLAEQELVHRIGWFIRVRWLFLAGLCVAILAGVFVFHVQFPLGKVIAVTAVVLVYNTAFYVHHELVQRRAIPDLRTSRLEAGFQIALDLLALTTLLHFTGGAENPFSFFYLFHVIVGSMLLPNREAWLVAVGALLLFLAVVVLEYAAVLPHYAAESLSTASRHQDVMFLFVKSVAFLVTIFSTVTITCSIVNGLRLREQQVVGAQQALLRKSEDLQQAYATLKEKQNQLVQTEKQAALGQLVAGIAHEINNPIQFIHGNMAVLAESFGDILPILEQHHAAHPEVRIARLEFPFFREQVPLLLQDMKNGAARIGAIVRDLRTFARRDEGRLDEAVDLNEAIEASMRLLHNKLKRYRVEKDLDPTLPRLHGNLTQLEEVVVNTLMNAAQALGDDPNGTIRVRTRAEKGGHGVRLSIQDNGPGISREIQDRIFDPFFTTKHRSGGTGLGLSITYGIVQQHHGDIQVETTPGGGTTFHYLLPVDRNGKT